MISDESPAYAAWTVERLRLELERLEENLRDLEETHTFTFCRTSVHIGAEQAQSMQESFEEERRRYRDAIAGITAVLQAKGG